jgi:ATP-dependent RNA helicase RhlE
MRAIAEAGYEQPTPIQAEAIPHIVANHDLIGTAQTGTGKTAAFVLPMLQRLLTQPTTGGKHHRALIITPTRELAEQINDNITMLAKHTGIRSATIYGGVGTVDQERAIKAGVEILVACPGRLLDHMDSGLCKLNHIEVLVLDEADRMFDMGFLPQVRRILERVNKQRQTLLFSATFPKEVEDLARSTLRQPKRVAMGIVRPANTVTHALYPVPKHLKRQLLFALLKQIDAFAMIVFTRTKHRAEALMHQLTRAGLKATSLHGDRSQNQRQRALDGFREGKFQVLVATDIAARGLDIDTVSHVINYDIPDTVDAYIHRIGRTGRAERDGDALTLIAPEDNEMVRDIEQVLGYKIARKTVAGFDYAAAAPLASAGQARPNRRPERHQPKPAKHGGNGKPAPTPAAPPQKPARAKQDVVRAPVAAPTLATTRRPLRKRQQGSLVTHNHSGRTERTYLSRKERQAFG